MQIPINFGKDGTDALRQAPAPNSVSDPPSNKPECVCPDASTNHGSAPIPKGKAVFTVHFAGCREVLPSMEAPVQRCLTCRQILVTKSHDFVLVGAAIYEGPGGWVFRERPKARFIVPCYKFYGS